MTKKYKLLSGGDNIKNITVDNKTITVHRIEYNPEWFKQYHLADESALEALKGSPTGWLESEANLAQTDGSIVMGDAVVCGNAWVNQFAIVKDNALVTGNAVVSDGCRVEGNAIVSGMAELREGVTVTDNAKISGDAVIFGRVLIGENARINGTKIVTKTKLVKRLLIKGAGQISIYGDTEITGTTTLTGHQDIFGHTTIHNCYIDGNATIHDVGLENQNLSGRYTINEDGIFVYFEKTHIPKKFGNFRLGKAYKFERKKAEPAGTKESPEAEK